MKTDATIRFGMVMIPVLATVFLSGCAKSPNDTVGLIRDGDKRACSTPVIRRRLQEELTPFLKFTDLKKSLNGRSLEHFGFVFDPIIALDAKPDLVECAASGYLSLDGKTPLIGNTVQFQYSLASNLNNESEYVFRADLREAQNTTSLLYNKLDVLEY